MRCPKCHYIAFDSGERCKNCGYEFSLSVDSHDSGDLVIRAGEPMGPMADLTLRPDDDPPRPPRRTPGRQGSARRSTAAGSRAATSELPLFVDEDQAAEEPLVRPSPTPRAPLAVRRTTPGRVPTTEIVAEPASQAAPPATSQVEPPAIASDDLDAPLAGPTVETPVDMLEGQSLEADAGSAVADERVRPSADDLRPRATPADRVAAGAVDLLLIGSIDAVVLYLTTRLLQLGMSELVALPMIPLLGFLALLNGGYFVAFTAAGGQTIGKMARSIQVVGSDGRVTFGQAVLRTMGYVLSALPFGLGFVACVLGSDGVALHDRLAGTRVVRCQVS